MRKSLLFTFLTFIWLVVLFPKEIIWDRFENYLIEKGIKVEATDKKMKIYILYNEIFIKNLKVQDSMDIKNLEIKYNVINPLHVDISSDFEGNKIVGDINLYLKKGIFYLKGTRIKNSLIKSYFKKDKKGYRYEFSY